MYDNSSIGMISMCNHSHEQKKKVYNGPAISYYEMNACKVPRVITT